MGGAKGGSKASGIAVATIMEEVSGSVLPDPASVLTDAITKANTAIFRAGHANPALQGMGTTVAAILIGDNAATSAHVGDSRIYQLRGSGKVFRSFDHSMVFELVRRGSISEEEARLSDQSNVILRALGTKASVEVEINDCLPYLKGDRFLLCSDGIWGAAGEKEILRLASSDKSVDKTVENIVEAVDKIGIASGGRHDNLTACLIETNTNSKKQPKMNRKSKIIIAALSLLLLASLSLNLWMLISR
jgi:serine/threonine protein phosphatase PrpC